MYTFQWNIVKRYNGNCFQQRGWFQIDLRNANFNGKSTTGTMVAASNGAAGSESISAIQCSTVNRQMGQRSRLPTARLVPNRFPQYKFQLKINKWDKCNGFQRRCWFQIDLRSTIFNGESPAASRSLRRHRAPRRPRRRACVGGVVSVVAVVVVVVVVVVVMPAVRVLSQCSNNSISS